MEYYTAAKAREVLGDIPAFKLRKYVLSGKLHRYVPPGGAQGLYSADEVNALAREIRAFYSGKSITGKDGSNGRSADRTRGSSRTSRG